MNPDAKDPVNQRFGWVKAESLKQYPQTDDAGPWKVYGKGRATSMDDQIQHGSRDSKGQASLRMTRPGRLRQHRRPNQSRRTRKF